LLVRKPRKLNRDELAEFCRDNPDATHKEAAERFNCGKTTVQNALVAIGFTRKKTKSYKETDENERAMFVAEIMSLPPDSDLFYADESGFDEFYDREYGYAPCGVKVYGSVSGKHYVRTSIVAACRTDMSNPNGGNEIVAPFAFQGTMDGDLFAGWAENVFVPMLTKPGKSVLLLDNASVHTSEMLADIAATYGFKIIFLPKYSPDFNPIEHWWANVKIRLRYNMRRFDSFWQALIFACQPI
jgi:transposase